MDLELIKLLLNQGLFFALFALFLYWFLTKYLPEKDAQTRSLMESVQEVHKRDMENLQATWKEAFERMFVAMENHKEDTDKKLEKIELAIKEKR